MWSVLEILADVFKNDQVKKASKAVRRNNTLARGSGGRITAAGGIVAVCSSSLNQSIFEIAGSILVT